MKEIWEKEYKENVNAFISQEEISYILASADNIFKCVERYKAPSCFIDFELIAAVNYADIANEAKLKDTLTLLISNQERYQDEELIFLAFHTMFAMIWKLDVLFLTHLKECVAANAVWNYTLGVLAQNKAKNEIFNTYSWPYWLRNSSLNYAASLPENIRNEYMKLEVVMIKANDIQAHCKKIGKKYIITLDYGIYIYLQEWIKILLTGYRIRQYCIKRNFVMTEPVRTGAQLFLTIADILNRRIPAYQIPPPAMNFKCNDYFISRENVENQIAFILGHELGHILLHTKNGCIDRKKIELEADDFSVNFLKNRVSISGILNKEDPTNKMPFEENDIQSSDKLENRLESIEILFIFYKLYYYACQKRNYIIAVNTDYFNIDERKKNIYMKYFAGAERPFVTYAEDFAERIQKKIDES